MKDYRFLKPAIAPLNFDCTYKTDCMIYVEPFYNSRNYT